MSIVWKIILFIIGYLLIGGVIAAICLGIAAYNDKETIEDAMENNNLFNWKGILAMIVLWPVIFGAGILLGLLEPLFICIAKATKAVITFSAEKIEKWQKEREERKKKKLEEKNKAPINQYYSSEEGKKKRRLFFNRK